MANEGDCGLCGTHVLRANLTWLGGDLWLCPPCVRRMPGGEDAETRRGEHE